MKRIFIATGVICFFLVSVTIQTSTAQNRAVVIPLFSDGDSCPPCPPMGTPAPVPKTGQSTSYLLRDDGALQMGVTWPIPRFWDNLDGTVTDNLTNLIWLKNANCFGFRNWESAISDASGLADGQCGLSDGSVAHDWRLPNIRELYSLVDFSNSNPALPTNHPFSATVQSWYYWSSTSNSTLPGVYAFQVEMGDGTVPIAGKMSAQRHVWPVRGPN